MKNEQTAVIKDMEFLLNELHKEWERPGEVKSSVSIPSVSYTHLRAHET